MPDDVFDVLVIGGGQAGLATGYHLKREGLNFYIIEESRRIGDIWRKRYESLTLFTPRSLSALPDALMAGDPEGYPSRTEFADYLEAYAARWWLPVATGVRVIELVNDGADFLLKLCDGSAVRSRSVVVATGSFQIPGCPALAAGFQESVDQFDPVTYRNPQGVSPGRVLVVGDGASGRDIAAELAKRHETFLAVGKPRRLLPERFLGRSVWWWFKRLGLVRARPDTLLGRMMRDTEPFPNRGRSLPALRTAGVHILPRLLAAQARTASFADGTQIEVDTVVWAVGYRDDFGWLRIPNAQNSEGGVLHREGVSPVPGLFFVGRRWQRNRASALIMGVGEDAEAIVRFIASAKRPNGTQLHATPAGERR